MILSKTLRPNDFFVTFREAFGMFFGMNRVRMGLGGIAERIVPDL
jgi:hypothetical protein